MDSQVSPLNIFDKLGLPPTINACGIYTDLGGSIISPTVWHYMTEMNSSFVSMPHLLKQAGQRIADLIGAEAAYVSLGASAAITLGTAVCMTGKDGRKWEQLPNTTGMKNEVIIQHRHRYKFDHMARLSGATLVEVGNDNTTPEQIAEAIGPQTAAIMFPAHLDGVAGTVSLRQTIDLGHQHHVPILVDAAYLSYPTEMMSSFTAMGSDLVCFSAKYYGGPNAGGFICGRSELIDMIAGLDFTGYESGLYRTFGRPFKLDRTAVVATVIALEEWFAIDHQERWRNYAKKARNFIGALQKCHGITLTPMCFTYDERLKSSPINCVAVGFDSLSGKNSDRVAEFLANDSPSIRVIVQDNLLVVVMETLLEEQELIIAARIKQALDM